MARPALIKAGSGIMVISIAVGVAPTVIAMMRAFNQGASNDGSVDAEALADIIGMSMLLSLFMFPVLVLGLVLLIVGILAGSKEQPEVDRENAEGIAMTRSPLAQPLRGHVEDANSGK